MSVAISCIGIDCPNYLTLPSSQGVDQNTSKGLIRAITKGISKLWASESITFGSSCQEVFSALEEVYKEASSADWDGYGANAVSVDAYEEAKKIINLLPSSIQAPDLLAEPTGEIGFEWRKGKGQVFVISVKGKNKINYAGVFGGNKVHGSEYFDETLPIVVVDHLRRLYL